MHVPKIGIVGGGPGGLMTAYMLQKFANCPLEVTLFEASPRLGGKILTPQFESFPIRSKLTDEEVAKFQAELSTILDYVALLDSADTSGLEPTYQVTGLTNVMRPDTVYDYGVTATDLLKNVPSLQDGLIKVGRMIK